MRSRAVLFSTSLIFILYSGPVWAVNPHAFVLKQQMDRSEDKLRQAEKASGIERQKLLETQMKLLEENNRSMRKDMEALQRETMHMGAKITFKDIVEHVRRDEKYHLVMNRMMDQMIRDERLLLEIIKKK